MPVSYALQGQDAARASACDRELGLAPGYRRLLRFLCLSSVIRLSSSATFITVVLAHIFGFSQILTAL